MKIEVTTAEILAVCHTYIAIADNMNSIYAYLPKLLVQYKKMMKKSSTHGNSCGNCTKHHTPGRDHFPTKDSTCPTCQKLTTGSRTVGSLTRSRMPTRNQGHNPNIDMEEGKGQMKEEFQKKTLLLMKS